MRGTTTSLLGETGWDGLKVHDVIKEKGFMSVSLREKVAKSTLFADKGERTIIAYLKVPKGTPGIMVDVAVNSPFESEFLLGPGTKIMVTKKEIKDGKKILEGLVLP